MIEPLGEQDMWAKTWLKNHGPRERKALSPGVDDGPKTVVS